MGGLLHNAEMLIKKRPDATTRSPLVINLLRASGTAMRVALRFDCKLLLSLPPVQHYLKHEWSTPSPHMVVHPLPTGATLPQARVEG